MTALYISIVMLTALLGAHAWLAFVVVPRVRRDSHLDDYMDAFTEEPMARTDLKLGQRVRHIVHGVEGILVTQGINFTGCDTWVIQPAGVDQKTGGPKDRFWADESVIEILDPEPIQLIVGERAKKNPLVAGPVPG